MFLNQLFKLGSIKIKVVCECFCVWRGGVDQTRDNMHALSLRYILSLKEVLLKLVIAKLGGSGL